MLELEEENRLIRIRAGRSLESSDYDRFMPLSERAAALGQGAVPMVIELAPDFSGWELSRIWRDLQFNVKHEEHFSRIAVIGTKVWHEWAIKFSDILFPPAKIRFFDPPAKDGAERWPRTGTESEPE
jgi:hypothetical protein